MRRGTDRRSSGELPVSAISQKSRSHAKPTACSGGLGNAPTSRKPSGPAQAEIGRFEASECSLALLAGYCPSNKCPHISQDSILKGKRESATIKQL